MRRAASALLLLALALAARAQEPAAQEAAAAPAEPAAKESSTVASLRPTGPVTVTADRAEWAKGGAMLYSGNVSLASDTLTMKGDRLELRQKQAGNFEAILNGAPARLDHAGGPAADGEMAPPVSAQAKTLYYDTATAMVQLSGGSHLTRGTDEITGDSIRYDVAARRIRASGGEGGQVRIVIQPPKPGEKKP
jgi:lipopolysaccharide export system protein LptA